MMARHDQVLAVRDSSAFEEGGKLSGRSVALITTMMSLYMLVLMSGSLIFLRICAGL